MYRYSNCALRKSPGQVIFAADAVAIVERDEAIERLAIPYWWEDAIRERLAVLERDVYYVCTRSLRHGQFNRVTDYNGIWGIAALPRGIGDFAYDTDCGRVYCGIIRAGSANRLEHYADVAILMPKDAEFPLKDVWAIWEKHRAGFGRHPPRALFQELGERIPEAFVIHYPQTTDAVLEVYGPNVDARFDPADAICGR